MDPHEQPGHSRTSAVRRGVADSVRDRSARVADAVTGVLRRPDDADRKPSFVPAAETVMIDARRHPLVLVTPALRTITGVLLLAVGIDLPALLLFAGVTALWAATRMSPGARNALVIGVGAGAGLLVAGALLGPAPGTIALLAWLGDDVADWYTDRLVVTDKRIYRRHGVLTRHSPSIALTGIAYIDASVPPFGRLLRYGTLRLDSVAQRDAPLSRFDLIPDVVPVSHEILRLRSQAMPRYQQPY
ncbi:MAG: hypothetical protein JWN88_743 [Frankiales bacterium]|nr:hypothetical protein [Frankiales bacterium]